MPNITITPVDIGNVVLKDGDFRDDTFTAVSLSPIPAGTIMARDTVSGKLVLFVLGGSTNGDGVPKAVLTYDITPAAAGDVDMRVLISGEVRMERLIIAADGDASNVDAVVIDQLRDFSIVAIDTRELNILDNS